MKVSKINLEDFRQSELEVTQLLEAKGGSGNSNTSSSSTSCSGSDTDCRNRDCDS